MSFITGKKIQHQPGGDSIAEVIGGNRHGTGDHQSQRGLTTGNCDKEGTLEHHH